MPIWSTLLRLLLVVAFVFNTTGTAMASVHLAQPETGEATPSIKAPAAEAPPCHQHPHVVTVADEQPSTPVEKAKPSQPSPDCCESGTCRCACVHHAPALMIALGFYPLIIEHARSVRPMSSGHAPPALPHLIRPPIG